MRAVCPLRAGGISAYSLTDRAPGYGPGGRGSIPCMQAVAVADMVMQRIVDPPYAGSNPVGHLSGCSLVGKTRDLGS